ncbi:hypothetical protein KCP73_08535 [Salmonella enterica subsp. enterica]|nr:hypothetical protein KCP73_08535 [Salmonella enterica subsp. enterica]
MKAEVTNVPLRPAMAAAVINIVPAASPYARWSVSGGAKRGIFTAGVLDEFMRARSFNPSSSLLAQPVRNPLGVSSAN